jgi:hypothetical protein
MFKCFAFVATIGVAVLWPATPAGAQHIHFGGGGRGGGIGVHFGDDDHHDWHDDHWDHDVWHNDHWDHHHHDGWHDSDWLWVVPALGPRYRGSYYSDQGNYYYMPQNTTSYAAKPIEIEFGGYAHVDDLAWRLERLANELCLELHYNYKHNPGYAESYRAAYQILDTAKFIRVKENQADRDEVAGRLNELDGLFHQLEANVKGWSRRSNRQIGQGGAQTKLDMVAATLHHLMHDVGVAGVHGAPSNTDATGGEVAPPPEPAGLPTPSTN